MKVYPLDPGLAEVSIKVKIVNKELNVPRLGSRQIPEEHVSSMLQHLAASGQSLTIKGPLCNKPGLVNVRITQLAHEPSKGLGFRRKGRICWSATTSSRTRLVQLLKAIRPGGSVLATISLPEWSSKGYSEKEPGFVLWHTRFGGDSGFCGYGSILKDEQYWTRQFSMVVPKLRAAHLFAHRYAKRRKRLRDRMEYHFGVLLEWDHQRFTTVVELAWQNGVGGVGGRSNWVDDPKEVYDVMPDELKIPVQPARTEIRLFDHPATTSNDLLTFMKERPDRFLCPSILRSRAISLKTNSATQLSAHLLQYCSKNGKYALLRNNCQTFAVDLFMLLTGQRALKPFIPVRLFYRQRVEDFKVHEEQENYDEAV